MLAFENRNETGISTHPVVNTFFFIVVLRYVRGGTIDADDTTFLVTEGRSIHKILDNVIYAR